MSGWAATLIVLGGLLQLVGGAVLVAEAWRARKAVRESFRIVKVELPNRVLDVRRVLDGEGDLTQRVAALERAYDELGEGIVDRQLAAEQYADEVRSQLLAETDRIVGALDHLVRPMPAARWALVSIAAGVIVSTLGALLAV